VTTPSGGLAAKQNQFTYVFQPDDEQGGQGALTVKPVDTSNAISATEGAKKTDRGVRIVFAQNQRDELRDLGDVAGSLSAEPGMKQQTYVAKTAFTESNGWGILEDGTTHTVDSSGPEAVIQIGSPSIRRLTPLECERLQGFPDGWTDIPSNSINARYRQLGNAVAVPVVEWILKNIVNS